MSRIFILGGYGGFGAYLSRRLSARGHHVFVAGRRICAAEEFCAALPGAEPIEADRNQGLEDILDRLRPDLVIDAAGPFQGSDYHVPKACIAAGIPYIDLADDREFVLNINALDEDARRAGIAVIAGASSVPALSGAVIRKLTAELDEVSEIEIAISASNRAILGTSVTTAILSYAGKPVTLWRGKRWQASPGLHLLKRERFELEGRPSLSRLVAFADVPDLALFPKIVAGAPSVIFRAGPEFTFHTIALWLMSWLVRWRIVKSLAPLAGWLGRLRRLTRKFGGDRSAMSVEARGFLGREAITRRWNQIAEDDDGPEIPTLATTILAEKMLSSSVPPGAHHAGDLIELEEFEPLFAELSIHHGITETRTKPLYARLLGDRFDELPAMVQAMHRISGNDGAAGHGHVVRGGNPIARLVASLFRFPPEGEHPLHVAFTERNGVEQWTRDFDGHRFTSRLSEEDGRVVERFGALRFHFDLPTDASGLAMVMRRWSIFRVPMPMAWAPRTQAREWQEDDEFCFDAPIALPLIGLVVRYGGRLRKITSVS